VRRLVVLDERWNSALTYFGFEVAKLLRGEKACAVVKGAFADGMCKEEGIETFYIEDPRKGFLSSFKSFFSLLKVIRNYRPDTVIVIRGDMLLFSAILKPLFRFKLVRIHGEAKGIKDNFLNRLIHRSFVDLAILSSKKLQSKVVNGLKTAVIKGIVDTEKFKCSPSGRERVRKELNIEDEILIGLVGRFDRVKGHETFIKGLSYLINEKGRNVRGLIIGEEKGISAKDLILMAERFNVKDRIVIVSERRKDIIDLMSAIDVGVITSVGSEIIARVLLEFMSIGKPVIASRVGVMDEIVEESFGYTFKSGDWKDFAEKVERVIERGIDKLGIRAREVAVERYSELYVSSFINHVVP